MRHTTKWIALAGLALALLAIGAPASAQTPTPEGTVITNTASAHWTDANGNTYTDVTASVALTVGYLNGIDVASATLTVTPGSPGTGETHTFTIHNTGNGSDHIVVAGTADAGLTITGYTFDGTTYSGAGFEASLNAALAAHALAADTTITIVVIYDVAAGQAAQNLHLTLTATTVRAEPTTKSDNQQIAINPVLANGLEVTPDAGTDSKLPSNGTQYQAVFNVRNTGNATRTIDLTATYGGAAISVVSVNGQAGATASINNMAAGANQDVTVVYTIADVAAGTTDDLTLTGTVNGVLPAVTDAGKITVTVVKPAVTVTKEAYKDDGTTLLSPASDKVMPGDYIRYRITVANGGTADASGVVVTDVLPAEVTFDVATDDGGWTSVNHASGTVTGTLNGALAPSASHYFTIRVRVK